MTKDAYVIAKTETGYCAHVRDLPGCLATAATEEEARRLIEEGIEFHIGGLRLEGYPVPEPTTLSGYAEVA